MPIRSLFLFMAQVFDGDDWKQAKEKPEPVRSFTRAEMQRAIDLEYGTGKMELEDWRKITDDLGNPPKTLGKPRPIQ